MMITKYNNTNDNNNMKSIDHYCNISHDCIHNDSYKNINLYFIFVSNKNNKMVIV